MRAASRFRSPCLRTTAASAAGRCRGFPPRDPHGQSPLESPSTAGAEDCASCTAPPTLYGPISNSRGLGTTLQALATSVAWAVSQMWYWPFAILFAVMFSASCTGDLLFPLRKDDQLLQSTVLRCGASRGAEARWLGGHGFHAA